MRVSEENLLEIASRYSIAGMIPASRSLPREAIGVMTSRD
jgi:hypothetical protein